MQLFKEPQDLNNLVSSRYQKNIESKLRKSNKDSVLSGGSFMMQSNVFDYDHSSSPVKK